MKERPILMSAPMVRATLREIDPKTQTRRVVKWRDLEPGLNLGFTGLEVERSGSNWVLTSPTRTSMAYRSVPMPCPYGMPGGRLWVREAFRFPSTLDALSPSAVGEKALGAGYSKPWCPTQFEADGTRRTESEWRSFVTPPYTTEPGRLRAGMHMPRWASRITLEITGVRVERLQDISEADARAEGCSPVARSDPHRATYRTGYAVLWDEINGAGSWDANPWVWCLEFRRVKS